MPGSTQLIGGQVSRGERAPASHTCPGPSKALTLPWLPSAKSSGEFSYGLRATGEVAQKRGPQPCTRPWPRPQGASSLFLSPGHEGRAPGGGREDPLTHLGHSIFLGKAYVVSALALTPTMASSKPEIGSEQSRGRSWQPHRPSWKRVGRPGSFESGDPEIQLRFCA